MFHHNAEMAVPSFCDINKLHQRQEQCCAMPEPHPNQCKPGEGSCAVKPVARKTKRIRTAFTTSQLRVFEETYTQTKYVNIQQRRELAKILNVGERQVILWFQNRRMKEKRETEMSHSSDSSIESINTSSENVIVKQTDQESAVGNRNNDYCNDKDYTNNRIINVKETDNASTSTGGTTKPCQNYCQNYNSEVYANYNAQFSNDHFQTNTGFFLVPYFPFTNPANQTCNNMCNLSGNGNL